jgi:hypothetical protein
MNYKTFSRRETSQIFGQATKKKFCRSAVENIMKYAFLAGASEAMNDVVKAFNENREVDRDVLIGEIQTTYLKYGNELVKNNFPTMNKLAIEDLLEYMGFMEKE